VRVLARATAWVKGKVAGLKESLTDPAVLTAVVAPAATKLALTGLAAAAQGAGLVCPTKDQVMQNIFTLQWLVFGAMIALVFMLVIFNVFGVVSTTLSRIGDFFSGRMGLVIELFLIYFFLLWNLNSGQIVQSDPATGCAVIDYEKLMTEGPFLFRIIGQFLSFMGINITNTTVTH